MTTFAGPTVSTKRTSGESGEKVRILSLASFALGISTMAVSTLIGVDAHLGERFDLIDVQFVPQPHHHLAVLEA